MGLHQPGPLVRYAKKTKQNKQTNKKKKKTAWSEKD